MGLGATGPFPETLENNTRVGRQTGPVVLNRNFNLAAFPGHANLNLACGVENGVPEQIKDNLLQLVAIPDDEQLWLYLADDLLLSGDDLGVLHCFADQFAQVNA